MYHENSIISLNQSALDAETAGSMQHYIIGIIFY